MRIEEFRRELDGGGYRIVSTTDDYELHSNYYGEPIKMSLTQRDGYKPCTDLEELIHIARLSSAFDENDGLDFDALYGDIMRGVRSDWQLGEVEVYPGGIVLGYGGGDAEAPYEGRVYISGIQLDLTFETSRTRLGFDPTYRVRIQYDNGKCLFTRVDEDLGYMRRTIYFEPKDSAWFGEEALPANRQVIRVLEYVGL